MRTPRKIFRLLMLLAVATALCGLALRAQRAANADSVIWLFDRTDTVGGHPATTMGHPHVIESLYGKAVEFNGVDDALFVNVHPLATAKTWTWEVIFRPDIGGAEKQRFFHLQQTNPATGEDAGNRMLLEIRVVGDKWCFDSFAMNPDHRLTLLNCKLLHPLGAWYRVTFVYDGKELRNYVGDELQGSGEVQLAPQGEGNSAIGARTNKTYFFKGAILMARMTPRALPPDEFLAMPPAH